MGRTLSAAALMLATLAAPAPAAATDREAAAIADLFRATCFEHARAFERADAALGAAGGQPLGRRTECRAGRLERFAEWRFAFGPAYGPVGFVVSDTAPTAPGQPARFICGYTLRGTSDTSPGRATVTALGGRWEAGHRQDAAGRIRKWGLVRLGAGTGIATSVRRPANYDFNLTFETVLKPCEASSRNGADKWLYWSTKTPA